MSIKKLIEKTLAAPETQLEKGAREAIMDVAVPGQPAGKITATPGKSGSSGVYRLDTGHGPIGDFDRFNDEGEFSPGGRTADTSTQRYREEQPQYNVPGAGTVTSRSSGDLTVREDPEEEIWRKADEAMRRRKETARIPVRKSISPSWVPNTRETDSDVREVPNSRRVVEKIVKSWEK